VYRHSHWRDHEAEEKIAQRQTSGLVGIVVVLLLLICGLFLVRQLRSASMIQDCLMSGRKNCGAVLTGSH
jgi:hypothetical protein